MSAFGPLADIQFCNAHIRLWHLADIPTDTLNVCFRGKADMPFCGAHVCF
jgi:hypothetical protein